MNEIENTLRTLLAHNIVYFTYRKVNGEIRHAIGTRNLTLAEIHTHTTIPTPQGAEQPHSYYDVEKMGWRSYKPENLISIDRVNDFNYATSEPIKQTKKGELPKREIPISKPMGGGADIDKLLGGLFGGIGFGGGIPKEEIRKSMDKLGKDIEIVPLGGKGGFGGGAPISGGKVGTPTFTDKGVELEMGIGVEDFAKMVAHYVVEELVSRIKSL